MQSIFYKILTIDTSQLTRESEVCSVFCELKFCFKFFLIELYFRKIS